MIATHHQPNAYGNEGVDHLNISIYSQSALGRILDPSFQKRFEYPHLGRFASVLNLWHWLKSEPLNDALRTAHGRRLKAQLKDSPSRRHVPNFSAIVGYATHLKLLHYPHAYQELKDSHGRLELLCYHQPKGCSVRVCSAHASVIVPVVQALAAHQDDGAPDLRAFITSPDRKDEQYYVGAFLSTHLRASPAAQS